MKKLEKAPFALTFADKNCRIEWMNEKAKSVFSKYGNDLTGKNLKDCHNALSKEKIDDMYSKKTINAYTIEKNGIKKLIYQFPVYDENEFAGYGELSLEIPDDMPHFKR
ncbi:MAG: hypothetical protein GX447_07335 [Elusimicrobia bacterium]|nr:hypothetical protein [Elusimicrobiota bacterium]